jgi:hypothetical protein
VSDAGTYCRWARRQAAGAVALSRGARWKARGGRRIIVRAPSIACRILVLRCNNAQEQHRKPVALTTKHDCLLVT